MIQALPEEVSMIPDHHVLRSRLATAALALSLSLTGAGIVAAQDATPAGSTEVDCAAPEPVLPEGTPGASPVASPVAENLTAGPVVDDQATIDELTQVVTACAPEGAANLEVMTVYGYADGRYGVDYQYRDGNQLMHWLDVYSNQTGTWTLEQKMPLSPRSDMDTITASVKVGGEAGIELSPAQFPVQPAVNFHVNNQGADAVTFSLYAGPADFDPASVEGVEADAVPDTLSPIGSIAVLGGTELDVIFEEIEPGSYAIVIFDTTGTATNAALVTLDEPIVIEVPDVVGGGEATATPAS